MKNELRDEIATVLDAFDNEGPRDLDVAADAIMCSIEAAYGSVLKHYAEEYCEGWCKDAPPGASFSDCGGCRARLAIT